MRLSGSCLRLSRDAGPAKALHDVVDAGDGGQVTSNIDLNHFCAMLDTSIWTITSNSEKVD